MVHRVLFSIVQCLISLSIYRHHSCVCFTGCRLPYFPLPIFPKWLPKFPLPFLLVAHFTGCPFFRCPFFRGLNFRCPFFHSHLPVSYPRRWQPHVGWTGRLHRGPMHQSTTLYLWGPHLWRRIVSYRIIYIVFIKNVTITHVSSQLRYKQAAKLNSNNIIIRVRVTHILINSWLWMTVYV